MNVGQRSKKPKKRSYSSHEVLEDSRIWAKASDEMKLNERERGKMIRSKSATE